VQPCYRGAWARKLEQDIEAGLYPPPETSPTSAVPTLRDVVNRHLRDVSSTHKGHAVKVDILRRIVDGHKQMAPVAYRWRWQARHGDHNQDIRDARLAQITMRGAMVNPGTVCRELSLLNRVFIVTRNLPFGQWERSLPRMPR
jgi:hypothetical protein